MEALTVLLKESGLSAKEVCALQWGNLLLDDADLERVFVRYRRDDLAIYTHNYTFPLSPYGALYVNAWRAYLEKKCPAERLADSAYIVSQDELGQKAFASGELITYIRTTVSAYTIGYAGRIKLEGMASALGVQLFRNTRRNHLIEVPGTREGKYPHIYCPAPRWAAGDSYPAGQWQQSSRRCANYTGSDQCTAGGCYRSPCSGRMLFGYFKRVIISRNI